MGVNKTATEIAVGDAFSCAILNDGSVSCWGNNDEGQTEGGTPSLGANRTATHIVIGVLSDYVCTLLDDKTVKCWGVNDYGQTGGSTSGSEVVLRGSVGNPLSGQNCYSNCNRLRTRLCRYGVG